MFLCIWCSCENRTVSEAEHNSFAAAAAGPQQVTMKKKTGVFELPPKCPALADKITGIFGWRHTYRVSQKQKGIPHCHQYLHKTYSLNLPRKTNPDSWVVVHHLQSQSGILDPDDHVSDVADDREEIIASYEDCPGGPDPGVPQGGGDGASGSSVGTGSPDIFRAEPGKYGPETSTPHIEVTSNEQPLMVGLGLQVRRGSEPTLHQLGVTGDRSGGGAALYNVSPNGHQDTKRWSAAPVCRSDTDTPERLLSTSNGGGVAYMSPEWNVLPEEESHDSLPQQFSRSGRLSMQFLGAEAANGYRWIDAADRAAANVSGYNGTSANSSFSSKSLPRESKRKEPLGQANASVYESIREKDGEMLLVVNENGGPLGLTAIPDSDIGGLLVQSVEPGSRADRGRVRRGDRILEINNIKLVGLSESSVQEHLKKSLSSPELRLRVIRAAAGSKYKRDNRVSEMIEAEEKPATSKVATVSPTRKIPGAPSGISLQAANTRKLGKLIEISLKKGMNGLGFSVTTRDNQAGGQCPIYIKNILSKGAAVEDGRLKPGDRLLEVDGVPMTGKSQSEVVSILRATEYGATVRIVVSRQQELADVEEREIGCGIDSEQKSNTPPKPPPPVMPKSSLKQNNRARSEEVLDIQDCGVHVRTTGPKMSPSGQSTGPPIQKKPLASILKSASTNQVSELFQEQSQQGMGGFQWKNREILTLHIPVHDTEKAGLGVSVKGKTGSGNSSNGSSGSSSKHDGDLGIFVKSVLHGGAASRDGRLKMNDQLLSVNGVSLLGQSNAKAMDKLRSAMLQTGKIILTVARRIGRPVSTGELLEAIDNSNSSEQSGATVIYLTPDKHAQPTAVPSDKQHQPSNDNIKQQNKRYSNPVLDRLTGGTGSNGSLNPTPSANCSPINQRPVSLVGHGLRNESYYMATNDNWSPAVNLNGSNAVLIEEDPEPTSPTFHLARPSDAGGGNTTSTPNGGDVTYASQLSLDTNPPAAEAFSRDAVGRRSMSEKHHAALDARETGTYQRNKKLREERERERKLNSGVGAGSIESLTQMSRMNSLTGGGAGGGKSELRAEALDRLGELGPSLGMKKSSSLESLQTMVQEIQMADEMRGPNALRTPRGRGREEILRAAVERPPETQAKKHWLLEEATPEVDSGGFVPRGSPFQSSMNDGKGKNRQKKNGLFRGIGHMFRFGKHRKDGIAPISDNVPADYTASWNDGPSGGVIGNNTQQKTQTLTVKNVSSKVGPPSSSGGGSVLNGPSSSGSTGSGGAINPAAPNGQQQTNSIERSAAAASSGGVVVNHPPLYQPPPPPPQQNGSSNMPTSIHHTDVFNHRYSHYVNYEELQQQISNRLTLSSRSSSYGNLASGGSSANHIYALISHINASNDANNAAAAAAAAAAATARSRSSSPVLVEELLSTARFQTLAQQQLAARQQQSVHLQQQQQQQQHHRQLSSDYCRYVSRALFGARSPTATLSTASSGGPSPVDFLSESTLDQMRLQVRRQREKVEEESRRHHHYHSQRSARNTPPVEIAIHHQQQKLKQPRPVSSYYDCGAYETIQHSGGGSQRKTSQPSSPSKQQQSQQSQQQQPQTAWNGTTSSGGSGGPPGYHNQGSIRSRGPFVTQVQIQNQISYQ
ncbi:partitioning defective 3 homolog isoform X3 [Toxorhynchites rutilus septentrionalis]|uniref:partitioning defective 3 homolog isoform X3 n=1 Tax=Toxorhynchites rutilus septentrionalis TaxID=329112 RepID=UPI0024787DA9|nr:partitioning defective 3 homolog isoform X3 [Toxorhynchites rutilus septentrionalis]